MGDGNGRIGGQKQGCHGLTKEVRPADDDGVEAGQVLAVNTADENHGTCRGTGNQSTVEITGRKLAGIDDMQAVDVLLRQDGLDDRFGIQMFRQGKLNENTVDGGVDIQGLNEGGQFLLRCFFRQRVLDRSKAALLGHAALR